MKVPYQLDEWQKEILAAVGNLCINCGRQVGKSTIVSIKVAEYMAGNHKKNVLVISVTEDQAEMMLQKVLIYMEENYPKMIAKGKDKPTKHILTLTNGCKLKTKAVGQYGLGVLGMTIDVLVVDEAAYMPEMIWASVSPMLLTTGGNIWLISTPNAKEGYFYDCYTQPERAFKIFHVNSEEVANRRPEPMRTIMLQYLASEKARMTDLQYAQQYLAQFLEELRQLFPDELIRKVQTLKRDNGKQGDYFLGSDIAGMGKDDTTAEIFRRNEGRLYHAENLVWKKIRTTETADRLIELDKKYQFVKMYIDDGGMGVAVFDQLLREDQTKRKVVAINNASRSLDNEDKKRKKLMKEDLYMNLLRLMERGEIALLDDDDIFLSLKSITIESDPKTNEIRIYGRYAHIAEGIIRAAWCVRDKYLSPYVVYN